MIALLCFLLTLFASPFKSKSRLEAENAVLGCQQHRQKGCAMSRSGTKRTYRDVCPFARFRGEADIPRCILTIMSDANGPIRS